MRRVFISLNKVRTSISSRKLREYLYMLLERRFKRTFPASEACEFAWPEESVVCNIPKKNSIFLDDVQSTSFVGGSVIPYRVYTDLYIDVSRANSSNGISIGPLVVAFIWVGVSLAFVRSWLLQLFYLLWKIVGEVRERVVLSELRLFIPEKSSRKFSR